MPYSQTNSSFHFCISSLTAQLHEVNVSSPSSYSYDAIQLDEANASSLSINHYNATPPYETWLAQWTTHLAGLSETGMVFPVAAMVMTLFKINRWQALLMEHLNRLLVNFFISGLTLGFRIGFNQSPHMLKSA